MNIREFPLLFAKGFCMGAADLVPGVSGGTMAFITGIYERLLNAIRSFDQTWAWAVVRLDVGTVLRRPDFPFLIPLVIGIFAALMFFTRVVSLPKLLQTHPELVYGLFFGLILASIAILLKEVGRMGLRDVVTLLAGTLLGLLVVNLVPFNTPEASWFVVLAGAIAICAMVLPGISGSFILLLMRKYAYILEAVAELNFAVLLPFALGCVAGLVLFTRFLVWLLRHYYRPTLLVIKGILLASLWVLWPFQARSYVTVHGKARLVDSQPILPAHWDGTVASSILLIIIGYFVVLGLHRLAAHKSLAG